MTSGLRIVKQSHSSVYEEAYVYAKNAVRELNTYRWGSNLDPEKLETLSAHVAASMRALVIAESLAKLRGEDMNNYQYKVEECSPGSYMVYDRELKESLLYTNDLKEACTLCCSLRALEGHKSMQDVDVMVEYCKHRFMEF